MSQDASLLSVIYIDNAHSVWFNNNNNQYFQQVMSPDHIWTALKSACLLFRSRLQEVLCIPTVLTSLLLILWVLALSHTMANVITFTIYRLTEHNFAEWLVDIQANLRQSKLWKYTQKNVDVTAEGESKRWINERKQWTSWHQHCLLKSKENWQRRTSTTGTKCSQNWATFCSLMKTLSSCISLASTTLFDLMTMSLFLTFSHMWKFLKNALIQPMFKWTTINKSFFAYWWVCQSGITFSYKYEVQLMAWRQQKQQKCY